MIKKTDGTVHCNECVTLITQKDYDENGGKCQLCRGGGLILYVILYRDAEDRMPEADVYITLAESPNHAHDKFIAWWYEEFEWNPEDFGEPDFNEYDIQSVKNVEGRRITAH